MGANLCKCFFRPVSTLSSDTTDKLIALKKNVHVDKIPLFSLKGQSFLALPSNVYDGDTLSMVFFLSPTTMVKYRCRCLGYDSPEMKPALKNPNRDAEKIAAVQARNRFIELLQRHPHGLVRIECHEFDKYGRLLVEIHNEIDPISINKIMIAEGHGYPYEGRTKQAFVETDETLVMVDVD